MKSPLAIFNCLLLCSCAHQDLIENQSSAAVEMLDLGGNRYTYISDIDTNRSGNLYVLGSGVEPAAYIFLKIDRDGSLSALPGDFWNPVMAVSDDGDIHVANVYGGFSANSSTRIYQLDDAHEPELLSEWPDSRVSFMAVDGAGKLLIFRSNGNGNHNQVYRWDPRTRQMNLLAGSAEPAEGLAADIQIVDTTTTNSQVVLDCQDG